MKKQQSTLGESLIAATKEAIEWDKNKKSLMVTDVEVIGPPDYSKEDIVKFRKSLGLSQALFAKVLGCSSGTIKAWEQGDRSPTGLAKRLLEVYEESPEKLKEKMSFTA